MSLEWATHSTFHGVLLGLATKVRHCTAVSVQHAEPDKKPLRMPIRSTQPPTVDSTVPSFSEVLTRLRKAADERQLGVHAKQCYISRRDLHELLFHFVRLDNEARTREGGIRRGA